MKDEIYKKQVGGDHYKSMAIQPSEFINRNNIPFAEGNAIKYLCRHKQKNQKEDLLKAKHYIDMAIDRDYPEEVKDVKKDFLEDAEKEKKELEESYNESVKQTKERKQKEKNSWGIIK